MNKKLLILGILVLANPAYATKARLQGLGEDTRGSFYINDNRNIWLNAAQINTHTDMATFEYGDTNATVDQNQSPRAEGGITKKIGNLNYGVYFGSANNSGNQVRAAAGLISLDVDANGNLDFKGTANEENSLDFFIGGGNETKWGASLGYSETSDETVDSESKVLRVGLGAIFNNTQIYTNANLLNTAEGALEISNAVGTSLGLGGAVSGTAEFKGTLGIQVGAIHTWNENNFNIEYRQIQGDSEVNLPPALGGATGKRDQQVKQAQVSWGRVTKVNERTNVFTKVGALWADAKNDGALGRLAGTFSNTACSKSPFFCEEYKTLRIPVVVGIEVDVLSWLQARFSVQQVVWGKEEDKTKSRTIKNNTIVNAGASFKIANLSLDGLISTSQSAQGLLGENTATGRGTLRLDELMTRVGVTYSF